jgi:hypothetical protein
MSQNKRKITKKQKRDPYDRIPRAYYMAPPPYQNQKVFGWKIRCEMDGPANLAYIIYSQLADLFGVLAVTAATGNRLTSMIRLKRVSIWGAVETAGTPVTVGLKFPDLFNPTAGLANASKSSSDTSVSFDRPAYCTLKPSKDNAANLWSNSASGNQALFITGPAGSVIDFDLQGVLDDIGGPLASSRALTSATVGEMYHCTILTVGGGAPYLTPVNPLNYVN